MELLESVRKIVKHAKDKVIDVLAVKNHFFCRAHIVNLKKEYFVK
jgi:hypothetical protein